MPRHGPSCGCLLPPTPCLPSRLTCTRPARPIAVPCAATYCSGRRLPASHWPRLALRLPVTGSSTVASNARTSTSASDPPSVQGPMTPMSHPSNAVGSGRKSRTARASFRSTPTQPGPLSHHLLSTMSSRVIRNARVTWSRSSSLTGPSRRSGGACNASRSPRVMVTSPAPHSCTMASPRGVPPASSQACALPERRVAGERQLAAGGEDAEPVVGLGARGAQQERRLRQVGPLREQLHPGVVEVVGVVDDRDRVAGERAGAEDVDLAELVRVSHALSVPAPACRPGWGSGRRRRTPW